MDWNLELIKGYVLWELVSIFGEEEEEEEEGWGMEMEGGQETLWLSGQWLDSHEMSPENAFFSLVEMRVRDIVWNFIFIFIFIFLFFLHIYIAWYVWHLFVIWWCSKLLGHLYGRKKGIYPTTQKPSLSLSLSHTHTHIHVILIFILRRIEMDEKKSFK